MKKLKYLLIPLISLLFIVKANALTSNYNLAFTYNSDFYNNVVLQNEEKINNIKNYINNTKQFCINSRCVNTNNNNVLVKISNLNSSTWIVRLSVLNYLMDSYTNSSSTISMWASGWANLVYNVTFNNNIPTFTSDSVGGMIFNYSYGNLSPITSNVILTINNDYYITDFLNSSNTFQLYNDTSGTNIPIRFDTTDIIYQPNENIPSKDFFDSFSYAYNIVPEPTYNYTTTILDNGNVKIDFTFNNYVEGKYAYEIKNNINNEYYGIQNPFSEIYNKIIPYGNTYSIELSFDTTLYVTLAEYEQVEETSLYWREEISTDMIDINNVIFQNEENPYFIITLQTKNRIEGRFQNTKSSMTCWTKFYDSENENLVLCNEDIGFIVNENGYVDVIIKKNNEIIYNRKINFLGGTQGQPYIIYEINKQDFYSVINWYIENEVSNMTYRYSIDNGQNFSSWINYNNNNNKINVFDNNTIIIEIADNDHSTIYDSKAIIVINDIKTIDSFNNNTINFIDKFKSIFNVNSNILNNINSYWNQMKLSKIYLIIFIPFIITIISGIIYLIRRK